MFHLSPFTPERKLNALQLTTGLFVLIHLLLPAVPLALLLMQWFPAAWTSWILAIITALLLSILLQSGTVQLMQPILTRKGVLRLLNRLVPPFVPNPEDYPNLTRVRAENELFSVNNVFGDLCRNVVLNTSPAMAQEWTREQIGHSWYRLRGMLAVSPLSMWPSQSCCSPSSSPSVHDAPR